MINIDKMGRGFCNNCTIHLHFEPGKKQIRVKIRSDVNNLILGFELTYHKYWDNGATNPTQRWFEVDFHDIIKKIDILIKNHNKNRETDTPRSIPIEYCGSHRYRNYKDFTRLEIIDGKTCLLINQSFILGGDQKETVARCVLDLSSHYNTLSTIFEKLSRVVSDRTANDVTRIFPPIKAGRFSCKTILDITDLLKDLEKNSLDIKFLEPQQAISYYSAEIRSYIGAAKILSETDSIVDYIDFNDFVAIWSGVCYSSGSLWITDDEAEQCIKRIAEYVTAHSA